MFYRYKKRVKVKYSVKNKPNDKEKKNDINNDNNNTIKLIWGVGTTKKISCWVV